MSYKIIGTDLDGTALNEQSILSPKTMDVFRQANDQGVKIVVATGRAQIALPEQLKELPFIKYGITSNGARVVDIATGETLYENYIAKEAAEESCNILRQLDMNIEVFIEGKAYIGRREYDDIMEGRNTTRNKQYIMESRIPLDNIFDLMMEHSSEIENVNVNYTDMDTKEKVGPILEKIANITLTSSVPHNHEIEGATTNKADGLRFVMEKLGYTRDELMAFGDNPNDIAMIQFAGMGVAVENAQEEVKEKADYIAPANYEDGVAKTIERFVLNK